MPSLSMFYGIIVRMYADDDNRHHTPHIHAGYSGDEVVMSLDGEVLEGRLPKGKLTLLKAWVEIHGDELRADWELLQSGESACKIEPLK